MTNFRRLTKVLNKISSPSKSTKHNDVAAGLFLAICIIPFMLAADDCHLLAMVLVGLGILVASFTLFVVSRSPSIWQRFFDGWCRKDTLPAQENGKETAPMQSAQEKTTTDSITLSEQVERNEQNPSIESSPRTPKGDAQPPSLELTSPNFTLAEEGPLVKDSASKHKVLREDQARQADPAVTPDAKDSPTAMPPPARPPPKPRTAPGRPSTLLMPPPPRPSALRPLPKTSSSLTPPPSAASALRAPPSSHAGPKNSLPATSSTLASAKRPSRKVILKPGHSPLDWAHLTSNPPTPSFLRGAQLPQHLIRVTPSLLRQYTGRHGRDAWSTWQGRVYNVTPYLDFHPGGKAELLRGAGKVGEAEKLFGEVHPWVNWEGILGECLVGIMVAERDLNGHRPGEIDLEEMD